MSSNVLIVEKPINTYEDKFVFIWYYENHCIIKIKNAWL